MPNRSWRGFRLNEGWKQFFCSGSKLHCYYLVIWWCEMAKITFEPVFHSHMTTTRAFKAFAVNYFTLNPIPASRVSEQRRLIQLRVYHVRTDFSYEGKECWSFRSNFRKTSIINKPESIFALEWIWAGDVDTDWPEPSLPLWPISARKLLPIQHPIVFRYIHIRVNKDSKSD